MNFKGSYENSKQMNPLGLPHVTLPKGGDTFATSKLSQ